MPAPTPTAAALEQLVAGQAEHHQRPAHPLGEILDQVQHSMVGPVNVLEHQDHGPAPGHRLEHRAHRREEVLAHALGIVAVGLGKIDRSLDSEQPADRRRPAFRRLRLLVAEYTMSASMAVSSFSQASSPLSPSTIPASARITSPSAQYTIPEPYGRQRPSRNIGRRVALAQPALELVP